MAARGGDRARLAVTLTGVGPQDTVVYLGCGPGTAVRRAARLGATVIGVDPARVMRRVATVLRRSPNTIVTSSSYGSRSAWVRSEPPP